MGRGIHHFHTRFKNRLHGVRNRAGSEDVPVFALWESSSEAIRYGPTRVHDSAHRSSSDLYRVVCSAASFLACGMVRQVKVPFADPDRQHTRGLTTRARALHAHDGQGCGSHLGIALHTVKEILKRYPQKQFSCPFSTVLKLIGIDEMSFGYGHRYLTVVLDLFSVAVVLAGEEEGADSRKPFWKRLKCSRARIEALAMDMYQAYIPPVTTHLPQATIVFDHVHVIKLMNEKLTDLMRNLCRESTDLLQKEVLKGTGSLHLRNPANLRAEASITEYSGTLLKR